MECSPQNRFAVSVALCCIKGCDTLLPGRSHDGIGHRLIRFPGRIGNTVGKTKLDCSEDEGVLHYWRLSVEQIWVSLKISCQKTMKYDVFSVAICIDNLFTADAFLMKAIFLKDFL